MRNHIKSVSDLLGRTLEDIQKSKDGTELVFTLVGGERCVLYHRQECCESVYIDDIAGDLGDLVGPPILKAEVVLRRDGPTGKYGETRTWTFYHFATVNGYVDVRWVGTSNGQYSESVHFEYLGKLVEVA